MALLDKIRLPRVFSQPLAALGGVSMIALLSGSAGAGTGTINAASYLASIAQVDGVTDNTAAIQAAIDACPVGGKVIIPAVNGSEWRISSAIVVDKAIHLQIDAGICYDHGDYGITFTGSYGAPISVVSVAADITVSGVIYDRIELASTSGWAVGDKFKIYSGDTFTYDDGTGDKPFYGEINTVVYISGNYLYTQRLECQREANAGGGTGYQTTVYIAKMNTQRMSLTGVGYIRANGNIRDVATYPASGRLAALFFEACDNFHIDFEVLSAWSQATRWESCFMCHGDIRVNDLINYGAHSTQKVFGYSAALQKGTAGCHFRVICRNARHPGTTDFDQSGDAFDSDPVRHGVTKHNFLFVWAVTPNGSIFDRHHFDYGTTYMGGGYGLRLGEFGSSDAAIQNRGYLGKDIAFSFSDVPQAIAEGSQQYAVGKSQNAYIGGVFQNVQGNGMVVSSDVDGQNARALMLGVAFDGVGADALAMVGSYGHVDEVAVAKRRIGSQHVYAGDGSTGVKEVTITRTGVLDDFQHGGTAQDGTQTDNVTIDDNSEVKLLQNARTVLMTSSTGEYIRIDATASARLKEAGIVIDGDENLTKTNTGGGYPSFYPAVQPDTEIISASTYAGMDFSQDDDGICQSQAVAGAGNLTINGAVTSAGSYSTALPRNLMFKSSNAADTTQTLTVTGTDKPGSAITRTFTANGTTAVIIPPVFSTITQIAASGAFAGNVTFGIEHTVAPRNIIVTGTLAANFDLKLSTSAAQPYAQKTDVILSAGAVPGAYGVRIFRTGSGSVLKTLSTAGTVARCLFSESGATTPWEVV